MTLKASMFDKMETEFKSLGDKYNKLLQDNNNMTKQIEQLHQQLKTSTNSHQDVDNNDFIKEQRDHYERGNFSLSKHVTQLEAQCQELTNQNASLDQEVLKLDTQKQQLVFDNDTLRAQLGVNRSGEENASKFHDDYKKLQEQFNIAITQKNQAQKEMGHTLHRLQQRESRCQQLAMQVGRKQ